MLILKIWKKSWPLTAEIEDSGRSEWKTLNAMVQEMRIVLRNADRINPHSLEDYLAAGGYQALEKARSMEPAAVIEEITRSKLRGRGGAGFSTGRKWSLVAPGDTKYVVCNLDEGEPGTYKDRTIVERDPHHVLEGMAICAHAIGAQKGYIYCRGEYAHLVEPLNQAIAQAQSRGILGPFSIEVRRGAGAYICGEETALLESLQGQRGEPRFRPPFPGSAGLWQQPTVVNNVETLATVPEIILRGAEWFSRIGSPSYPGTKILTLSGDVVNRAAFEVPTNTTLREVIYELGGGVRENKKLKAVQIGGAGGAFLPPDLLDTPIDFDSLAGIGAGLGSGAILVLDETRNILDVTIAAARFFAHESCGKCTPCREGTFRCLSLLQKLQQQRIADADMENLLRLCRVMQKVSFCGLGQTAPTPILSGLKHFPEEFTKEEQTSA